MSKSLVLGNGNMLVCFDGYGQVRDFYFPHIGLENQVGHELVHLIGIWVDGGLTWLHHASWKVVVNYAPETMVGDIHAHNEKLQLALSFTDAVYNESNIFIRNVRVKNLAKEKRDIKIFFNQQFRISETSSALTAYYDPDRHAVVHYKGRRVFLVSGMNGEKHIDEFSVGIMHAHGKEGTWKEAETGALSRNPIEHGSVDSTIGFSESLSPGGTWEFYYWVLSAELIQDVCELNNYILSKTPAHLIKTTSDFWHAWVNKRNFVFKYLSPEIEALFKKSLFIIRAHADNHGALIASGDSDIFQYGLDTYGYLWPRDGAYIALALDKAGYFDLAARFYKFINTVLTPEGYLLHKYRADFSLGSSWHPWVDKEGRKQLAIQEDETALILVTLWEHYLVTKDLEFIESIYNSLIQKVADFLVVYREPHTKLPAPSYDLWEEKYGISTYTACSVYGGLEAAARFADLLGKEEDRDRYRHESSTIKEAILKHLVHKEAGYFYKLINVDSRGEKRYDTTIDTSSFYGVFRFGVLTHHDPLLKEAYKVVKKELACHTKEGGIARYQGDRYFTQGSGIPGNPWFITTLWVAQYQIQSAETPQELEEVRETLDWVLRHALSSGMLSEQINPFTGEQVSVSPLTWSHSEFVLTVIKFLEKLEVFGVCNVCYPLRIR